MKRRLVHPFAAAMLAIGTMGFLLAETSVGKSALSASSAKWTDNFDNPSLDTRWSWIREDPTRWSLTDQPGYLRITTEQTFSDVNNLLVQDVPAGGYEIRTRVVFAPTENFQIAGLLFYQDDANYLTLGRAYCSSSFPACVGNGIYFDRTEGGSFTGDNFSMTTTLTDDAYLKVIRQGNTYTGYVSEDGSNWTEVGVHTPTITPAKIGLRASNQAQGAAEIPADFDFFTLLLQTFSDLPTDHWAWQFVEAIFSAGLTAGFPDGTYRPDTPVTRAEMAVFLKKGIHGSTYSPPTPDGSHPFSDISGHWAEAWIEDLYDEGFTTGFPDGTYRPDNQVTRAEMAVFLKKAIHGSAYTPPATDGSHPFSDIAGHWAEAWIEDLFDEGITSGFPDGTYRPENPVSRAEMAVFLVNAFSLPLP